MLVGDDLVVQLFIAATAIAVLGIAVTQAGWDQPNFVRVLFGLSGLLALTAIFWRPISGHLPQGYSLQPIASSPIAWLFVLLIALGTIGWLEIRARERWAKTLPERVAAVAREILPLMQQHLPPLQKDTRNWLSSYAIFELADQKLMTEAINAEAEVEKLERKYNDLENERIALRSSPRGAFKAASALQQPVSEAEEVLGKAVRDAYIKAQAERDYRTSARAKALEDIYAKLRSGDLVAKGFLDPVLPNAEEIIIRAAHWRIIRFNGDYTLAEGQGIKYIGITVARAA